MIEPRPIFVVGDFWKPTVEAVAAARPNSTALDWLKIERQSSRWVS
jgi:hypothetical protein